jgi:hypothetical protein
MMKRKVESDLHVMRVFQGSSDLFPIKPTGSHIQHIFARAASPNELLIKEMKSGKMYYGFECREFSNLFTAVLFLLAFC